MSKYINMLACISFYINPWIGESPPYLMGITQKPIKKGSGYCHSWARKREFKGRHDQRCQNFGEAKEKNYWLIITKSFSEAFYQVSSSNGDLDINTISQKLWALGRVWGPSMPFRGQADCFYFSIKQLSQVFPIRIPSQEITRLFPNKGNRFNKKRFWLATAIEWPREQGSEIHSQWEVLAVNMVSCFRFSSPGWGKLLRLKSSSGSQVRGQKNRSDRVA